MAKSVQASLKDMWPGNILGEVTEMDAVDAKQFKAVILAQPLKKYGTRAIKVNTVDPVVNNEGEITCVIVNKGTAFETRVKVKTEKELNQENMARMKAEEAQKNGQAPKQAISVGGMIFPNIAIASQVADAENILQQERIRQAMEMLQYGDQAIVGQRKALEGAEFPTDKQTVIVIEKKCGNKGNPNPNNNGGENNRPADCPGA